MQQFTVTGRVVGFGVGSILALTEDQCARRAHSVRVLPANPKGLSKKLTAVEVIAAVQFKYAETVGVIDAVGGLNKAFLQQVAPAKSNDAAAAKKTADAKAAAAAKKTADARLKAAAEEATRTERKKAGSKKPAAAKPKAEKPAGLGEDETAAAAKAGEGSMEPAGPVEQTTDNQTLI